MANPTHVSVVLKGSDSILAWRTENPGNQLDLEFADLERANLAGADLSEASLFGANLREADLTDTNLSATLATRCDFDDANLTRANLNGAVLLLARFVDTELQLADFANSLMDRTVFGGCDLSLSTGLSEVSHWGPSVVALDTLVATFRGLSNNPLPDELFQFFSEAGVSPVVLNYFPGKIVDDPIKFYSVFISFGREDKAFADKLHKDLKLKGVNCWKFEENAEWGRQVDTEIEQAVRGYNKLIVICSAESLARLAVLKEIARALKKENGLKDHNAKDSDVLLPVRLDNFVTEQWEHPLARQVRDKVIGDFRNPSEYERNLERLVGYLGNKAPST